MESKSDATLLNASMSSTTRLSFDNANTAAPLLLLPDTVCNIYKTRVQTSKCTHLEFSFLAGCVTWSDGHHKIVQLCECVCET